MKRKIIKTRHFIFKEVSGKHQLQLNTHRMGYSQLKPFVKKELEKELKKVTFMCEVIWTPSPDMHIQLTITYPSSYLTTGSQIFNCTYCYNSSENAIYKKRPAGKQYEFLPKLLVWIPIKYKPNSTVV